MATKIALSTAGQQTGIVIPQLNTEVFQMTLVGDSPLICHAWSEKAKKQMLDKQMKKATTAKAAKDPHQDFLESLYHLPGGRYGFPATALKACAVGACASVQNLTKVLARSAFFIECEMVEIKGSKPVMREDMVKISMGTSDIRHRGMFEKWWIDVEIRYNRDVLSKAQIINLFDIGGFGIGLGEWRPERDGMFGRFHVRRVDEVLPEV